MTVTDGQRAAILRFCAGAFGVAVAISLYRLWQQPAPYGQLPGVASAHNFDARAPFRFIASLLLLPIVMPLVLRPLLTRLSAIDTRRWAWNGAVLAMIVSLWIALATLSFAWTFLPVLAVLIACSLLRTFDARFSRRDMILAAAVATVWIALLDMRVVFDRALIVATLLVFCVRLIVSLPGRLSPAYCFFLAPLGLALQSQFFARDERHSPWLPMIFALVVPIVARFTVPDRARIRHIIRIALTWVIYPAACIGYFSAYSIISVEGKPRISVFEESEHIVPGAEMARGEKPYRDIIPPHGFIQDGLFDFALIRGGADSIGRLMKIRTTIDTIATVGQYIVAVAATGSPEVGLAASLLSNLIATPGGTLRLLPSLASLACLAFGLRRRRPRAFGFASALAAVSVLTSLDFGAWAVGAVLVALLRVRRWAYARATLIGAASVALPVTIAFAIWGIVGDALRVTLTEIPSWTAVYTLGAFTPPPPFNTWRFFPEVLVALFDHTTFLYVIWVVIVIALGAALTKQTNMKWEPLIAIGVWCALNGFSYAERQHTNFRFAVAPLLAVVLWRMFRSRSQLLRMCAPLVILLLLMESQPMSHLTVVAIQRDARGVQDNRWTELSELPRARGALFDKDDAKLVRTVKSYFDAHLAAGDTWFDFLNRGLLYYLFDRDCPIRQIEVAFYEPEARQREVIARLEANPHVKYALVPPPGGDCYGVDCIPNQARAPLVWRYLHERFELEHAEPEVELWRRK